MALSKSTTYCPIDIISALGIDPNVQSDVHEFLDILITTLKSCLSSEGKSDSIVRFHF